MPNDLPDDATPDPAPASVPPVPSPAPAPVPAPAAEEAPVPDEAELRRTATPATVRRAPKFSAFIVVGALVGIVLGVLATVLVRPEVDFVADGTGFISFLDGAGAIRFVMGLAGGVLGGFVGGALAVAADRRSRER